MMGNKLMIFLFIVLSNVIIVVRFWLMKKKNYLETIMIILLIGICNICLILKSIHNRI
jgi:hypothetical protein